MKNVLTFLFLTLSIFALGQNQINFNNSNDTWNVATTYPHATPQDPDFVETTTNVFGYNGDTLIGGEYWLKMFTSPDSNFISNLTYLGNIKEVNGVVVYMDTTFSLHALYNFNLQAGDSVLYHFEFGNIYLKVENIDSIYIIGKYYKRFHFQEPVIPFFYIKEVWIEEIGSIHGPLFPANPRLFGTEIPDSMYLTCFKINGSIIWNNPNYSQCFINIILGTSDLPRKCIKVFPNPVIDRVFIEFPISINGNHDVSIFDLCGKQITCHVDDYLNSVEIHLMSMNYPAASSGVS